MNTPDSNPPFSYFFRQLAGTTERSVLFAVGVVHAPAHVSTVCRRSGGYVLKFEIKVIEKSERVPHGISYSFTLHKPNGKRLLGFDNAHLVAH
jgi:hypothetical protein